jgi:hypothetical protein
VSPLAVARAVSAGRLGLGLVMMASPKLAMSKWVGEDEAQRPAMDLVTRAFGAREVLLGFLALHVADRPGVGKRTLGALALCDLTDLTVTVAHRESLPKAAVPMMAAVAGGAFASQLWASRELP